MTHTRSHEDTVVAILTAREPVPRLFKVGDRVRRTGLDTDQRFKAGLLGYVDEEKDEKTISVMWDSETTPTSYCVPGHDYLELIEPAPDPPTPEELLAEAISQSTKLAAQFQEALGMPEASWPDMVAEAKALSQFKAVHQSNTAAKLDKIKAALMGYDAAKLGGDAYSVVERFI